MICVGEENLWRLGMYALGFLIGWLFGLFSPEKIKLWIKENIL